MEDKTQWVKDVETKEAKEQKELRKEKEKETRMAKGMDQRRSP